MTTVKNIGGGHKLADSLAEDGTLVPGIDVPPGGTFECADFDALNASFPNKFKRFHEEAAPAAPAAPKAPEASKAKAADAPEGEDKTKEFPAAVENELIVVKLKGRKGWNILDEGQLVNDAPLKKGEVAGAIKEYLGD